MRYTDVEDALKSNIEQVIREAPRGKSTTVIEKQISRLSANVDKMFHDTMDLAELVAEEKSYAVRKLLREKEAEHQRASVELRELQAKRDTLTMKSVQSRLTAVRKTLSATDCC